MEPITPAVSLGLALAAGLISFASPCVLPLVPGFLSYLSGQAVNRGARPSARWNTLLHALSFVLGFSLIFVLLGMAASGIGRLLWDYQTLIAKVGGVVIVIFGLNTLGVVKIPFLSYDLRRHYEPKPRLGYLSSILMGFFFGAGWTPCVGVTLSAILTLALSEATLGRGALLLFIYSMGLGIPFLLMSLGLDRAVGLLRRTGSAMRVINIISGLFLVALGILIIAGRLSWLSQWMPDPGVTL